MNATFEAERRMGELLSAAEKNHGANGSIVTGNKHVPVKDEVPTLSSLGLTKRESAEAQKLDSHPTCIECHGSELLALAQELRRRGCVILSATVVCISSYRLASSWPQPKQTDFLPCPESPR